MAYKATTILLQEIHWFHLYFIILIIKKLKAEVMKQIAARVY